MADKRGGIGSIDFIDRQGIHLDRLERFDFWKRITSIPGSLKLRNPKRIKPVEKAKIWIEKSVVPSIEMMRKAIGDEPFYV